MSRSEQLARLAGQSGLLKPNVEHKGRGRGYTLRCFDPELPSLFTSMPGGWRIVASYHSFDQARELIPADVAKFSKVHPALCWKKVRATK